jgi:signal transduction histidine kinase
MNRALWVRFVGLSVVFALLLSVLYTFLIREVAGATNVSVQRGMCLFLARIVESGDYQASLGQIDSYRAESAALPLKAWVVSERGGVLARNTPAPPPQNWHTLSLPTQIHDIATYARGLPSLPKFVVVRLKASAPTYLILQDLFVQTRRVVFLQSVLFVATLGAAIFLGLTMLTLYLRGRSREAKHVIAAMRSGQLDARFTLGRLDALGQVMLDFNDMAEEIERLVNRLHATEETRRELLQDLGHDLRTPLTSLRASAETLLMHGPRMPAAEQAEFMAVIKAELDYLQRLIEQLFFIAEMTEPKYSPRAEDTHLVELVEGEIQAVAAARADGQTKNQVMFEAVNAFEGEQGVIRGDAHMLGRLFRNALENAANHASGSVRVEFAADDRHLRVVIDDDGPGMTREALENFGVRRAQRSMGPGAGSRASLGLGSVIIRSILSLHEGRLQIDSKLAGQSVRGTRLSFSFPRQRPTVAADPA